MTKQQQSKYTAIWLSHSSISDFLKCPRLYYLKNIWKNERGNKVNTVSPHLSLGLAVHQTIEPLANLKTEERFEKDLLQIFENNWKKFQGITGGFEDIETEKDFKERGIQMIKNVIENKGPFAHKTVKFYTGDFIPNIYLSEEENIILCGLVDWVEYIEKDDTLRVVDFKTGRNDEKEESMQLPIYKILVEALQKRKVSSGAYWYLDRDKFPKNIELLDEDIEEVKKKILEIGKEIKSRKKISKGMSMEDNFNCKYREGCFACKEFELIRNYTVDTNQIKYLGQGEYKQDLYFIKSEK
jgi:ATP-dependent helicase/DNAse subunit B